MKWTGLISPFLFLPVALGSAFADTSATPDDIRDIKGILTRDLGSPILMAALFFVLLTLFSLFFWLKRRRKKGEIKSSIPPHEVAWGALQALKRKDLVTRGRVEDNYLEMADIIRRYLGDRFGLKTSQMNTEECLSRLETTKELSQEQKSLLQELLKECDLVKFARNRPTPEEIEKNFGTAQEILVQTREVA